MSTENWISLIGSWFIAGIITNVICWVGALIKEQTLQINVAITFLLFVFAPLVAPNLILYFLFKSIVILGQGFVGLYQLKFPKKRITLPRATARKVPENG